MQRYTDNRQQATGARAAGDTGLQGLNESMSAVQSGMVRAFDDVLELMDAVSRTP
jgi:hypothetical protein